MKLSCGRRTKPGTARRVALPHTPSDKRSRGLQRAEQELDQASDYAQAIVETIPPLLVLGPDLRVNSANRSFYKHFRVSPSQTENCLVYKLGNGQWNIPKLRAYLEEVLPRHRFFSDFEVTHEFEGLGFRTVLLSGRQVDHRQSILLFIDDITERRQSRAALRTSEIRYRRLFEAARDGILILDPGTRKITDANPFMSELLGYPREELLGKELWEIGLLKDEAASRAAFRELQKKHFIRYEDLPLQDQSGPAPRSGVRQQSLRRRRTKSHPMQHPRHHPAQTGRAGACARQGMNRPARRSNRNYWSPNAPPRSGRRSANWKASPTAYRTTCARRCGPCKASPNFSWMNTAANWMSKESIIFSRLCAQPSGWTASFRMS